MTTRTTRSTVTFAAPVKLQGVGEELPAGTYQVETDEEAMEVGDRTAFRRVATLLYIPTPSGMRMCTVDGDELARAILAQGE